MYLSSLLLCLVLQPHCYLTKSDDYLDLPGSLVCPQNCFSCTETNQCLKCNDEYFIKDGSCEKCLTNCKQCTSYLHCTVCVSGSHKFIGSCLSANQILVTIVLVVILALILGCCCVVKCTKRTTPEARDRGASKGVSSLAEQISNSRRNTSKQIERITFGTNQPDSIGGDYVKVPN